MPSISDLTLRAELPKDEDQIRDLTRAAFAPMAYSDGSEPAIIDRLRRDGDLLLSLVALHDAQIVGHVAFSPVVIGAVPGWVGLGPISVDPRQQKSGIGSALIRQGLAEMRKYGAKGTVLIGDPGYYKRFGFNARDGLTYGDVPAEAVQYLSFGVDVPEGEIIYAPAFDPAA